MSSARTRWTLPGLAVLFWLAPDVAMAQARLVDIAGDANDPSNLSDTEPSIAVNPANPNEIAIVTFSESWGPNIMAPVWKSRDGGATWQKIRQIPQPTVPSPVPGQPPVALSGPGDQKVAFDAAGNILVVELGVGAQLYDFVYRQTGAPDAALTPGAAYGDDQPHLEVDRVASQACTGRAYSAWLNFGATRPQSTVSQSANSGVSMTDAAAGDITGFPNRTTRIALGAGGRAYVVYKTREGPVAGVRLPGSPADDFENAHFRVNRSDDCGQRWDALGAAGVAVHAGVAQTLFTTRFGVTGTNRKVARARSSDAWIAVDPGDEDVYVAYVHRDGSGFAQIFVARSTDRGATWSSGRVTDGTHHSAFPEIAVTANGSVGVLYVDFEDTGTVTNFRHRLARSFDDGRTWTDQILQAMDPQPIANAASGFLWGDYEGLTAAGATFYGVFTGESVGRTTRQLDPIFFTETGERPPPTLTVRKRVRPPSDPGRFNLQIDGVAKAANVRNGGSTGRQMVTPGTHQVDETAGANTDLADYRTVILGGCRRDGSVTLAPGQNKTCLIMNVRTDCRSECVEERVDCMEDAGKPGFPTKAQCAQMYSQCIRACH